MCGYNVEIMQKCRNTNMHYFWPWPYITANESTWIQSCGQWMKVTQSMCISEWVCVRSLLQRANNLRGVPLRASSMVTRWYSLSFTDSSWSAYGAGYFRPWWARSITAFKLKYISHLYTRLHLHLTHHCASLELQRFLALLCLSIWTFSLSLPGQSRWTVGLHSGSIKTNRKKQQEWWS